jgi:hypothetical protein
MKLKYISPVLVLFLVACGGIPKDALQFNIDTLADRQLQTRKFDIKDEKALILAGAGVLQDMGYAIDESETKLGVVVGSKNRDATSGAQVAGAVVLALLGGGSTPIDKTQLIRASLITRTSDSGSILLRVTFQRTVWNTQNEISKIEAIKDPLIYKEFFEKLSKSAFLEAQEI